MTAVSTATARSPEPLPRSRSRGGSGAGSSDQPPVTLRSPPARLAGGTRASETVRGGDTPESLAVTRSALTAQRTFRLHQLRQLDAFPPDTLTDPARAEIHHALRAAARSALRDIDSALSRIQQGSYGRCPPCGDTISVHRLRALPMTPVWAMPARHSRAHRRRARQPSQGPHPVETVTPPKVPTAPA